MTRTGRPRGFDRGQAVEGALTLFRRHGYDATLTAELRRAMGGISSASFHAAFTSKEALFREVLALYVERHGSCLACLFDPSVAPREAIERALRCSIDMQTQEGEPPGCLVCSAGESSAPEASVIAGLLAEARNGNYAAVRACVERAVAGDELAPGTDADALAVVFNGFLVGISSQARDGVPRAALQGAVTEIMKAWPARSAAGPPKVSRLRLRSRDGAARRGRR